MMPRIALVTPMLPVPHDQTRGRYIHETARALSQLAQVRVFFQQASYPRIPGLSPRSFLRGEVGEDYTLDGVDVEAFTYPALPGLSRATNGWMASRALVPRMRRFEPDLVLAYWVYPDGAAAKRAARRLGVPCIVGARGSDIHVRTGLNAHLTRRTLQGLDAILTVSHAMRDTAIATFGADPERVHPVVNGIDTDVFHPRDRQAMRSKLGVPADARLITYVGRFVEAKGMRELLQAFQSLAGQDPRVRLALVGDGVMREELAGLVQATGLAGRVTMTGGLEPAQVAEWIGASDVLTLPSWSEGYPNVVVEGIACGRPVVATAVGGTGEIIKAGNGILVPPRDAAALERGLADALARTWDAAAVSASVSRGWGDVAADTLAICRQVLGVSDGDVCLGRA
ncbi:glycosyl transferase family 1 [Pseudoxanthomonas japonensis]|uniref:Glycosyl transferase family 1 n=2 Tax=Pseudoxanthomonas japonensis TaxID=69284 RepID=A0ABQ6ZKF7_9GAMM|nr:glycosyl transferase family 1 [Pseudoxanthomonas japonensis]